jgi:hypothetical protein
MKDRIKPVLVFAAAIFIILALAGCMKTSAEDLYALPQLSERYLKLQESIDEILNSGAEYASPASGYHRQAIQLEDLDGDGVGEVIACFNFLGSDKPLKLCIFRRSGDEYEEVARIEGEGSGIDSISYADMDGDGINEIAVGWQIATGMNMLSVYTIRDFQVSQIINTDYTEYIVSDLDSDNQSEIVALRLSSSNLGGEATLYSIADDGEALSSTVRLTANVETLLRVRSTTLSDGSAAVLLESRITGGGLVTDILSIRRSKFTNITLNDISGESEDTMRAYEVYCRDINNDGVLDVPTPIALPSASETTVYYMIEWYSYSASGHRRLVATTYNNYSDGWYLVLPDEWRDRIAIRREDGVSGERSIVFSLVDKNGEIGEDFLTIYTLTGDNRAERASYSSRFVLLAEEETIYAASIKVNESSFELPISQDLIRSNFNIIYSEWITGET